MRRANSKTMQRLSLHVVPTTTVQLILLSLAALSPQAHAADNVGNADNKTSCPAFLNSKANVLVAAHLFDGDVSENAELAPDNENSASDKAVWDISGYKDSGRAIHLVCDYKDHSRKDLTVTAPLAHCYAKGSRKTATAWCGK
jgi:hypothetical protein